jgi:hypothetical protein
MNFPPAILDLDITPEDGHRVRLWLPLFLLWPLALALAMVALVFTILADVVLLILGQRYHYYTVLLVRSLAALCQTRGMAIRVNDSKAAVSVTVK